MIGEIVVLIIVLLVAIYVANLLKETVQQLSLDVSEYDALIKYLGDQSIDCIYAVARRGTKLAEQIEISRIEDIKLHLDDETNISLLIYVWTPTEVIRLFSSNEDSEICHLPRNPTDIYAFVSRPLDLIDNAANLH